MTDDQIHDLLDRAVREHQPRAHEPWRSVARRARRQRRRNVGLAAAGTLVLAVGITTALGVTGTGTGTGVSPAGPGGSRTLMSPQSQQDGSVVYRSDEGSIQVWEDRLLLTPEGWSELPDATAPLNARESYECPDRGRVVYRSTVMGAADDIEIPCVGRVTTPYVWQQDMQVPDVGAILEQTILPNGAVQWVRTLPDDPDGEATHAVLYPNLGQAVVSRGIQLSRLLSMLAPPGPEIATISLPSIASPLLGAVRQDGSPAVSLDTAQSQQLWAALGRDVSTADEPCAQAAAEQYQIGWEQGLIVMKLVDGCSTMVFSSGGTLRPSADTVALIESLAG